MKLIRLKNVEPGMITGREVLDAAGNVLMKPGMELNERAIAILERRGIESVWVESEDDDGESAPDVEQMKYQVSAELDEMFEGKLEDPVMRDIYEAVKEYQTRKLES